MYRIEIVLPSLPWHPCAFHEHYWTKGLQSMKYLDRIDSVFLLSASSRRRFSNDIQYLVLAIIATVVRRVSKNWWWGTQCLEHFVFFCRSNLIGEACMLSVTLSDFNGGTSVRSQQSHSSGRVLCVRVCVCVCACFHIIPLRRSTVEVPHLTFLELQYRFGDNPLKFQVVSPQNGTAVLERAPHLTRKRTSAKNQTASRWNIPWRNYTFRHLKKKKSSFQRFWVKKPRHSETFCRKCATIIVERVRSSYPSTSSTTR